MQDLICLDNTQIIFAACFSLWDNVEATGFVGKYSPFFPAVKQYLGWCCTDVPGTAPALSRFTSTFGVSTEGSGCWYISSDTHREESWMLLVASSRNYMRRTYHFASNLAFLLISTLKQRQSSLHLQHLQRGCLWSTKTACHSFSLVNITPLYGYTLIYDPLIRW